VHTVCEQKNNFGILPTTKVNPAFYPFGVAKPSTSCLARVSVRWQLMLRIPETGYHQQL